MHRFRFRRSISMKIRTMDAIADITAVSLLMRRLAPDEVIASPVHVGSRQVQCAHGILPVPAPATIRILTNIRSEEER